MTILLNQHGHLVPVPDAMWKTHVASNARSTQEKLKSLSADHHRVREFVVRELPAHRTPIPPDEIAASLELPLDRVIQLLDDLEKGRTYLFRDETGAVEWAYPLTAAATPHPVTFSTGEQLHAA